MSCPGNPEDCAQFLPIVGTYIGGGAHLAGGMISSAWQQVCQSFADAATSLLQEFAKAFVSIPPVNLKSPGISATYGISLGIAVAVAALLLIGQVIRTAFTHDGSALATGLTGLGKAVLAFLLTVAVATAGLTAADELTREIVTASFGSVQAMSDRLGELFSGAAISNPGVATGMSAALLLIFGLVGIVLVVVLWFELLLRNAAIAVLIATSPIAAAGQVSEVTRAWWSKLVSATAQLIILKPVIALVFAVGFGLAGKADDVETLLSGMLVLLLAVFAWPAIARFFAFASVQVAGGSGLAALLGFAAGHASGGGGPAGVEPGEFSRRMERRTMAAAEFAGGPGMAPGAGLAGGGGTAGGLTGAGAGAGVLGPAGVAVAGVKVAQRAVNSLTGHMEQMAGHAGIQGANPYAQPAGTPRYGSAYGRGYRPPDGAGQAQAQDPVPGPGPGPEPALRGPDVPPAGPAASLDEPGGDLFAGEDGL